MKARALPINEVIKFTQVDAESVQDQYKLTNSAEANFVLEQFTALKDKDYQGSLGVITPHREQATFINNLLNESAIADWLHEHQLKVMTFDTCQGEERDYILYSMVAKPSEDKHWAIFPVSMEESRKEGKEFGTREQRLNVGFSRAKETVHFVLSKPVNEYWGEIKTALLYYENALNTSSYELGGTDEKSPMEALVQDYFYKTEFYEKNKDSIELVPQFPLGEYLKSLDRNYSHPKYKVDFLLTFDKHKIVIEYDGFNEHFINRDEVNETNYDSYLKPADVYRQKVLEGYGYKFLRLNRFNLGKEPVKELDGLLANVVKKKNIRQGQLIPS
jgi:very-short-patch-repair endonuclease